MAGLLRRRLSRRRVIGTGVGGGLGGVPLGRTMGRDTTLQTHIGATPDPHAPRGMLTDVPGFLVGHATLQTAITGCTVILCPPGTTAGVEILGGWPATREMAILSPLSASPFIHAILFTGRSVYGLAAADGVVRWLDEHGVDIPQVPGAVITDLGMGTTSQRPGPAEGYRACQEARPEVVRGSVGAGTGATVGKLRGRDARMKGGIGTVSRAFAGGGVVAALAVVNAVGDVLHRDGRILAGAHDADGRHIDFAAHVVERPWFPDDEPSSRTSNTTLVAVATNAGLTKTQCSVVAHMAQAGMARAINPIFTPWDGDTVIVAASGTVPANEFALGIIAAEVVADSIRDAVLSATSLGGVPDLATPGARSPDDPAWAHMET